MGLHKIESDIGTGTIKLYYEDAYLRDFTGTVVSCEPLSSPEAEENCDVPDDNTVLYDLVLDRTAFFPEEGGQSHDRGMIADADVSDVQIMGGIIHHYVNKPFEAGKSVSGHLDFDHRFSNMQQHSAEHIFSGIVNSRFGYENVGFHLSDNEVTMDYSGPLTPEDIREIETETNKAIYLDIESRQIFPTDEELSGIEFRSKKEINGQVRLIEFPGFDICACCAPHVKRTGEIGILKVVSAINYKGGTRLSILAGERALKFLQECYDITVGTARDMTCGIPEMRERVAGIMRENIELKGKSAAAGAKLLEKEIETVSSELENVCIFTADAEMPNLRKAVNRLTQSHSGICGIFSGNDGEGYIYVIGSRENAIPFHETMKEKLGAKGGGQPAMVQGSVKASGKDIRNLFEQL